LRTLSPVGDPSQRPCSQLLKEKLAECSKTMNKIVKYMKEKGKYDGYVQMFGAPEIPEAAESSLGCGIILIVSTHDYSPTFFSR